MKKNLLLFLLIGSIIKAQTGCNASISPITICYPNQTIAIAASMQTDIIYLCGPNSTVYDTANPASIKYRQVFVNTGGFYRFKSTISNNQVTIWAKSGSTVQVEPGSNTTFAFTINKESGTTVTNLSSNTITVNTCSLVTGPVINCTPAIVNETQKQARNIILWPNPTSGKFNLEINSDAGISPQLSIINQLGEIIYTEKYTGLKKELSLENYPDGIYFLRLCTATTTETRKIILSR